MGEERRGFGGGVAGGGRREGRAGRVWLLGERGRDEGKKGDEGLRLKKGGKGVYSWA